MSVGLDPDSFWGKTPKEVSVIFRGQAKRLRREHNERAWLAWTGYALPRMRRPRYDRLLMRESVKAQTDAQQIAAAKHLVLMFGGKIIRKKLH